MYMWKYYDNNKMPYFQHTFILSCGGSWYDILLFYFIYFDLLASHSFVKETYIIYYMNYYLYFDTFL